MKSKKRNNLKRVDKKSLDEAKKIAKKANT